MGRDRTFVSRTLSKLNKGSLRGSIFNLCASAIGAGVLSLPYVCRLCGYVAGPVMMMIAAIAANVSLRMLAKNAVIGNLKSYSKICMLAGGKKLSTLLCILIIIFMFGSCTSY